MILFVELTLAVMEVYSDASEIGGHLAIGSLLFRKKHIKPFKKEWGLMLRTYGISHFHMTDCNVGEGVFKGKSQKECDNCARQAIQILLKYATKGCIFSVKKSDFDEVITAKGVMPNPFTLGVWFTLMDIRAWADQNDPIARISYVFEAGDDHQNDANTLLIGVAEQTERAAAFRYRNHSFVPKLSSYPAQAADILAWHGAKHNHRRERDKDNFRLRGDFNEIINKLRVTDGNHDRQWLTSIVEVAQRRAGKYGNELAGLAYRMTEANCRQRAEQMKEIFLRDEDPVAALDTFLSGQADL